MRFEDMSAHEPSHGASCDDIGSEVFSRAEASRTYQGGESIGNHGDYFIVPVLVRDYRSQSKGHHSVTGRE